MTNRIKVLALLLSLLFAGCTKVESGEVRGKKYEAARTDYVPMTTLMGTTMVTTMAPIYTSVLPGNPL